MHKMVAFFGQFMEQINLQLLLIKINYHHEQQNQLMNHINKCFSMQVALC